MIKSRILNQELLSGLAGLGHGHTFMVCDAGYPIPAGGKKIDLALMEGIPTIPQVLEAILSEMIVEEAVYCEEMEEASPELCGEFKKLFAAQTKLTPQWAQFELMGRQCSFFVRTGDLTPYGNIILKSASAVRRFNEKFDISF
jgi:D-ribose pyranase